MSWVACTYVTQLVRDPAGQPLTNAERVLMFIIASHINESEGRAWPAIETLEREAGKNARYVKRLLRRLESRGVLKVRFEFDARGRSRTNSYIMPGLEEFTPRLVKVPAITPPRLLREGGHPDHGQHGPDGVTDLGEGGHGDHGHHDHPTVATATTPGWSPVPSRGGQHDQGGGGHGDHPNRKKNLKPEPPVEPTEQPSVAAAVVVVGATENSGLTIVPKTPRDEPSPIDPMNPDVRATFFKYGELFGWPKPGDRGLLNDLLVQHGRRALDAAMMSAQLQRAASPLSFMADVLADDGASAAL